MTASAPRVALLSRYFVPEYAGAGIQASRMIGWLARRGTRFTVLTSYPGTPPAEGPQQIDGNPIVRFRTPRGVQARDLVFGAKAASWLLRHDEWDVLHCLGYAVPYFLPTMVARLRGRPVLIKTTLSEPEFARSPGAMLARGVRRYLVGNAAAIVTLSDALEEELEDRYGATRGIVRIPNGVDTELFHPASLDERAAARRAFGLPGNDLVIASCGELSERKNPVALVQAVARMETRPLCLVLAGPESRSAEDRAALDAAIGALPVQVETIRPGRLEPARVAELLRAADVFSLTSRAEGMPNSVLEAMATGLPCVVTDAPGSREVVSAGGGQLVPQDDVDALSKALDRLASDPAERERLGAEGARRIDTHYSSQRVADQYQATYESLIAGAEPARHP